NSLLPKHLLLVDRAISIGGGRNGKLQFLFAIAKLPWLLWQRYDVVLDLQNHRISNIVRKLLRPMAWASFDRYSPISAGDRTRATIAAAGLGDVNLATSLTVKLSKLRVEQVLAENGWDGTSALVVLNPAGFFTSRNWPLENYSQFARLWKAAMPATQFLFIGTDRIQAKARAIEREIGKQVNLVNKTNIAEAFAIVGRAALVLTEDGGLMHMAWVQGVPTLALFGSSRADWSAPLGDWALCLNSADMECGACMLAECKFGDNRCLQRYTPDLVFTHAKKLLPGKIWECE
ncbi:MAG: glycosyltransferase family 9 protein, partial [Flammeovirgaceae bacterium]